MCRYEVFGTGTNSKGFPEQVPFIAHVALCTKLLVYYILFDVLGSMHCSTIHTEKSNKMQQCIKIYYSVFI